MRKFLRVVDLETLSGLVILLGLIASPAAAQVPASSAESASVAFYSAATLSRVADSLAKSHTVSRVLGDRGGYQYVLVRRDTSGVPEMHAVWTDVMVVQSGRATLLSGGRLDGGAEVSAGETRGGTIVGGSARTVSAGDLVVIPAGLPHQLRLAHGQRVRYVTVKVRA